MSRSSSQVNIRQAYPQKAIIAQAQVASPTASPTLRSTYDPTRPATARVEVPPSRGSGSVGVVDSRPNRPSSAHTRLLTTYGAPQSTNASPDQAAVITKQDLRRKRAEEYLSDRVRQIYNDVGRDTRPVKKHLFHDGSFGSNSSGGRVSSNTYKGDTESLQDTIHALKFQLHQEADKRSKMAARCRRLEQVVAMKDKKLEEALALHAQHGSYNSYQRELANRERAYNHMLGKLREKIDQQATTLAAYEDTVNDLKASTKHTRVMEMEETLAQLSMELKLTEAKVEDRDRELAQCYKQLEDRSESTAQKAVKRLRTVVLALNDDKKRLDKETKVLKAYILAKERELAAITVAAKSQPKPKQPSAVVSPNKPTARPVVVADPTTPKPPPSKSAGRPLSASRSRPISTPGRSLSTPQRPLKSEHTAVVVSPKPTSAKRPTVTKATAPPPVSVTPVVPPLPLTVCMMAELVEPEIPSPPPLEKPLGLEMLQTKVAPTVPVVAILTVASTTEPPKSTMSAPATIDAVKSSKLETSTTSLSEAPISNNPYSNSLPQVVAPATADDDSLVDDSKDTTDIERILNGGGRAAVADISSPPDDDDMDDADFEALMAFETKATPRQDERRDETVKLNDKDDDDVDEEGDVLTEIAALKIQKLYKVYSRRRDSMELHRETKKKQQHRQSSRNKLQDTLVGGQDAVAQSLLSSSSLGSSTSREAPTRIPVEAEHKAASVIQKAYRRSTTTTTTAVSGPTTEQRPAGERASLEITEVQATHVESGGKAVIVDAMPAESNMQNSSSQSVVKFLGETTATAEPCIDNTNDESYFEPAESDGEVTPSASESLLVPSSSNNEAMWSNNSDGYSAPDESEGQVTPSASNDAFNVIPNSTLVDHNDMKIDSPRQEDNDDENSQPGSPHGKRTPSPKVAEGYSVQHTVAATAIQNAFRHSSSAASSRGNAPSAPTSAVDVNDDDMYSEVAESEGKISPSISDSELNGASPHPIKAEATQQTAAASAIQKAYRRSSMAGSKPIAQHDDEGTYDDNYDDDDVADDTPYSNVASSDGSAVSPNGSTIEIGAATSEMPTEKRHAAAAAIQKAFRDAIVRGNGHPSNDTSALISVHEDLGGADAPSDVVQSGHERNAPTPVPPLDYEADKHAAATTIQSAFRRSIPSTPRAIDECEVTQPSTDATAEAWSTFPMNLSTQQNQAASAIQNPLVRPSLASDATGEAEAAGDDDVYSEPGDGDDKLIPSTSSSHPTRAYDEHDSMNQDDHVPQAEGARRPVQDAKKPSTSYDTPHEGGDDGSSSLTTHYNMAEATTSSSANGKVHTGGEAINAASAYVAAQEVNLNDAASTIQHAFRHSTPRRTTTPTSTDRPVETDPTRRHTGDVIDDDTSLYNVIPTPRDNEYPNDEDVTPSQAPNTSSQDDVPSTSDRHLIESVMDHLDDEDDTDRRLAADVPLEYEDEFLDDDNADNEGISEDAQQLVAD
ncbi:hypothetical protein H257_01701 [Aphanomyces astaci]|uniref:Uncharacterized protein n=1 Tax=Aphanomyces astaci TaxID=112090 RepID=W4H4J9_APHAT|nr:hypothetical protein H257_01701 [Aphanomyces astaci]ETV86531.1 hypothetical protein H257_01701 [Aphanomyces astaci]|eukprot:XP_009823330.1 hypothetical protein H257_01701 [Aphanomyces astaci]